MGDWSDKRLERGSLTRRLRSLKTLTWSRLQIRLSVHMMEKQNKMLLSTTRWQYRHSLACVIPIDQYVVPVLVTLFLCVSFTRDSLNLFYYKTRRKSQATNLGSGSPWPGMRNDERSYFIGAFQQELENRKE